MRRLNRVLATPDRCEFQMTSETLADYGSQTKDPVTLTEMTRAALCRSITKNLTNETGELAVITLSPEWESQLSAAMTRTESGSYLAVDPKKFEQLVHATMQTCQRLTTANWTLLCSSNLRFHVRKLIERFIPQLTVISPNDIPPNLQITSIGVVGQ